MKNRIARVCEVLKRELSAAVAREVQFDVPLVTIHSVDITPDLKNAHVFVSAIGTDAERADVLARLNEARAALQQDICKRVILKNTPLLHFHMDESIERGSRVLAILDELGLETGPSKSRGEPR